MCGPKFCSMQITQDLRREVRAMEETALRAGMDGKSREFVERGATLYVPTGE
jgi:phosphomethylpyrimidine synthase